MHRYVENASRNWLWQHTFNSVGMYSSTPNLTRFLAGLHVPFGLLETNQKGHKSILLVPGKIHEHYGSYCIKSYLTHLSSSTLALPYPFLNTDTMTFALHVTFLGISILCRHSVNHSPLVISQ